MGNEWLRATQRNWVRIWFGHHIISEYVAEPDLAERYAESIGRRFHGLRVTNEPLPPKESALAAELPAEPLWPLTVQ